MFEHFRGFDALLNEEKEIRVRLDAINAEIISLTSQIDNCLQSPYPADWKPVKELGSRLKALEQKRDALESQYNPLLVLIEKREEQAELAMQKAGRA